MLAIFTIFAIAKVKPAFQINSKKAMRKELAALHPVIQFLLFFLAGVLAMSILMMLIIAVSILTSGNLTDLAKLGGDINSLLTVNMLKALQIAQSIGLFMVPYFIYKWVNRGTLAYDLKPTIDTRKFALIFGLTMFAAYPFINVLAVWNSGLHLPEAFAVLETWMRATEAEAEILIKKFLVMDSPLDLVINLLVIAVFPAISEELFFRGFLQNTLLKMGRNHHVAIWVTAFIFSAIHMQFLGFFPRFLLGAMLGYSAMYSRSLIVPIMGHFVNNGLAVVLTYFIGMEMMDTPEGLGALSSSELTMGAASAVALGLGMWVMRKRAVPIV
jgi:uncharacterized protein